MKTSLRKLYCQLTPILFLPLLATALTGIIYGLSERFFKLPDTVANVLMAVHRGEFLGVKLVPIYVLLMGIGTFTICLVILIDSRDNLISKQTKPNIVGIYRLVALILVIPLALCVETGVAYQLGRDWFGMSSQQTATFLEIHGGASLGTYLSIIYILIAGFDLVVLSIIGYKMTTTSVSQRKQSQQALQKKQSQQAAPKQSETPIYLSRDSLIYSVAVLKRKIRLAIAIFSLVFIGILYYATSTLLASIAIIVIIFVIPALLIAEQLIQSWQHQKEIQVKLCEREAESITMLKAIPDSMLRVSQDGICLSYMPAKEAKLFVLNGEIVNKHLTEFLAPEIARQFIKFAQLSLQTGSTRVYRFPISLDDREQYHEARFSPIGQTEVLIIVREIAELNDVPVVSKQVSPTNNNQKSIKLLTESELIKVLERILIQVLETILEDDRQSHKNHILFCLAIEQTEANGNGVFHINDNLMHQIVAKIDSYLEFDAIARLDNNNNELVVLVSDCSLEKASVLVDDLHRSLNDFSSIWRNGTTSLKFNIGLLEINADSPDAVSLMNAAKTTCQMAKQKVHFKTFW